MRGDSSDGSRDASWAHGQVVVAAAESVGAIVSGPAVVAPVRGHRLPRRPRRLVLALAALGAVGLASWTSLDDRAPAPAGTPSSIGGTVQALVEIGLDEQPTRGSLARDDEFVEVVRRLPWTRPGGTPSMLPEPPVEGRRVVFAGDVAGGRVALVVGRADDPDPASASSAAVSHMWFTGPSAALAGQMTPAGPPRRGAGDRPRALTTRQGILVLVTTPGDGVEISERPELSADGSRRRIWEPVVTEDGVAVVRLGGPPPGPLSPVPRHDAVVYRVLRNGAPVARSEPDLERVADPDVDLRLTWTRSPTGHGSEVAQAAAVSLLARLGSSENESEVVGHWAGPVPGVDGATAAVLTLTTPSGALVVKAGMRVPVTDGFTFDVVCGVEVRAAGAPPSLRTYAAACNVPDLTRRGSARSYLLVVAPPTVASVRTYDGYGNFLAERSATDGVVVVPRPPGTTVVEGVTRGGVLLGRSRLMAVDLFLRN